MALAQKPCQVGAARGSEGACGFPFQIFRPPPDDPELVWLLPEPPGDEFVDGLIHIESFVPVVRPVVCDKAQRGSRLEPDTTHRMKKTGVCSGHNH
ncbi:MAG: hypothetical protein D4R65_15295 [Verrucomicrobiaceae bacterium]|nr:MAG: hypothetical protein D4R65_15295 [Verrucomicrobiaceae bacterium]